jgi:hypothetical protein
MAVAAENYGLFSLGRFVTEYGMVRLVGITA